MLKESLKKVTYGCVIESWLLVIPLIFLGFSIATYALSFKFKIPGSILQMVEQFLKTQVFCSTRISSLTNVSVVLIGFYVTIMSIFGSNYSIGIVAVSKENLSNKFMLYIKDALISSFIYFIMTIFFDAFSLRFFIFIYTTVFLWVIFNLIRIAFITIKLYELNISNASKVAQEQDEHHNEIVKLLRQIKDLSNKTSTEYYDKLKEEIEKQKKNAKELPYDEDV